MNTLDKALLLSARIGVFFVPFVPLIISASLFFPFITGKGFAFRVIVEVVFACYLLLAFRHPEFRPKRSLILYGVLAFIAVVFLADAFAVNPFKAFWSNFERMEGFVTMIHLVAYFFVASAVLNTEKLWHRFFATSVGVSAFLGIYGILQLAEKIVINQGGVRLDGTFGNAAYFAGYMLFHIFLSLFLILRHRLHPGFKWVYGAAIALQIFTLIFTATRGAALGLVGGLSLVFLLVTLFERNNRRLRMGAAGAFLALILVVVGLYAARDVSFVKNSSALTRFASVSVSDAGPRLMVWGMAFQGFKENPVFGWGQEGFNYVFNKYYNPDMWSQEQWFDRTHNIFFDWLISAGALGLLAYLSLFAFLLWYIWKEEPTDRESPFSFAEKSVLSGLLAGYMAHNFFVFDNLISYILFFSLLAYVHTRFGKSFTLGERSTLLQSEQAASISGAVLLVLLCFGVYYLNFRPLGVASDLIQALRPQQKGITENLAFYKQAFAVESVGTQEVGEQAIQAAVTVALAPNTPVATKQQFVDFAVKAMGREIERAPNDARLRMFLGGLYNRIGEYPRAVVEMEKAHELSVNKQTIAFELANTYLSTNRQADALKLLKDAFERAPLNEAARLAYAASAIYGGDFRLASALLASSTNESMYTDERILKAYFAAKQYGTVISILKRRLERNPNDVQTHISLAAAYVMNGNRALAIGELQKAIELNPDFKAQGEHYINEIRAGRNP